MHETYWIIGASHGIGKALVHSLSTHAKTVVISGRDETSLAALKESCNAQCDIIPAVCDVSEMASVEQVFKLLAKQNITPTSIIFMAGVYTPMAFTQFDARLVNEMVKTNLGGCFNILSLAVPLLENLAQSLDYKPQIAICASVAGFSGLPNAQPYSATKAALINVAESLITEQGSWLDVKLINPGFVKTRLTNKNKFYMPWRITPAQAAKHIDKRLQCKGFEIHFPIQLTLLLKVVKLMPYWAYIPLFRQKHGENKH